MLIATRDAGVRRFVYASSSSVYGDSPVLPKREDRIGRQLSPYAVSKYTNELYAGVFAKCYGLETIGLRYFNVFGPRQDPNGPYAAVIPRWKSAIEKRESITIYGDGKTSRDFCYVNNAVQANLLAGLTKNNEALNQVYNVACGAQTSLSELYSMIVTSFARKQHPANSTKRVSRTAGLESAQIRRKNCQLRDTHTETKKIHPPCFVPERAGDIRHSLADISKALDRIGYAPSYNLKAGLEASSDRGLRDQ
jgi:UDP-N-acetylglucosamine 4-epimerase